MAALKKSFLDKAPAAELFLTDEPQTEPAKRTGAPEPKSRRVQLLLQPSVHAAIKAKADAQYMSFNDYVHQLLEKDAKEK